jgi:hypothetical protein
MSRVNVSLFECRLKTVSAISKSHSCLLTLNSTFIRAFRLMFSAIKFGRIQKPLVFLVIMFVSIRGTFAPSYSVNFFTLSV